MNNYRTLKTYFERKTWFIANWQAEVFGQLCSGEDGFYIAEMKDDLIEIISLAQMIKWEWGIDSVAKAKWINIDQLAKIRPMSYGYIPPDILLLESSQPQLTIEERVVEVIKQGAVAISNDGIPSWLMPVNDPKFLRELALACKKHGVLLSLEAPKVE